MTGTVNKLTTNLYQSRRYHSGAEGHIARCSSGVSQACFRCPVNLVLSHKHGRNLRHVNKFRTDKKKATKGVDKDFLPHLRAD